MRTKLHKSRNCASVVRVGEKWGNSKRSKEENLKKIYDETPSKFGT